VRGSSIRASVWELGSSRRQALSTDRRPPSGRSPVRSNTGDTTGNSPGTKWTAFNAIVEHLDYGRRYTARKNQVQRSFEDTALKQRALELVSAA
jgi:hypothetical protein